MLDKFSFIWDIVKHPKFIKFVSDLQQVGGFLRFHSLINLTAMI